MVSSACASARNVAYVGCTTEASQAQQSTRLGVSHASERAELHVVELSAHKSTCDAPELHVRSATLMFKMWRFVICNVARKYMLIFDTPVVDAQVCLSALQMPTCGSSLNTCRHLCYEDDSRNNDVGF